MASAYKKISTNFVDAVSSDSNESEPEVSQQAEEASNEVVTEQVQEEKKETANPVSDNNTHFTKSFIGGWIKSV